MPAPPMKNGGRSREEPSLPTKGMRSCTDKTAQRSRSDRTLPARRVAPHRDQTHFLRFGESPTTPIVHGSSRDEAWPCPREERLLLRARGLHPEARRPSCRDGIGRTPSPRLPWPGASLGSYSYFDDSEPWIESQELAGIRCHHAMAMGSRAEDHRRVHDVCRSRYAAELSGLASSHVIERFNQDRTRGKKSLRSGSDGSRLARPGRRRRRE